MYFPFQSGMTKTDAAVQTLSDINPDVVLEVSISQDLLSIYPEVHNCEKAFHFFLLVGVVSINDIRSFKPY